MLPRPIMWVVYNQDALPEKMAQPQLCRFCSRNFNVKDALHIDPLITEKSYEISAVLTYG